MPQLDNDAHERFCEEYLIDLNGTRAWQRTSGNENTNSCAVEASRLLRNANIRIRIRELMDERSKDTLIDAKYVVDNLNEVYNRCMQAEPVKVWNHVTKQMEETGEWVFDSQGANKSLELLGKHVAMFTEKSEVKTDLGGIIIQGAKFANKPNEDTANR